jgi:hypothetical protein
MKKFDSFYEKMSSELKANQIDERSITQTGINRVLEAFKIRKGLVDLPKGPIGTSGHADPVGELVVPAKAEQIIENKEEPIKETELNESLSVNSDGSEMYTFYRDKEETFECNVSISGASINNTSARLIIDTPSLNIVLYGKLRDNKCLVSIPKMTMFNEGTRGQVRLEIIVDDTLFVPWESSCVIEGSKSVQVNITSRKDVSVNFNQNTDNE